MIDVIPVNVQNISLLVWFAYFVNFDEGRTYRSFVVVLIVLWSFCGRFDRFVVVLNLTHELMKLQGLK